MKTVVNKVEEERWRLSMQNKNHLKLYATHRKKIKNPRYWRNNKQETIIRIFQSRALPLSFTIRDNNSCEYCITDQKDIQHILLECSAFTDLRDKYNISEDLDIATLIQLKDTQHIQMKTHESYITELFIRKYEAN